MKKTDSKERQMVYQEIKNTLGIVPKFFEALPDEVISSEWSTFKSVQLTEGALPNKTKELIGIGISAATKCTYCAEFHTTAAKLNGATDEEIAEALWFAKATSGWSTYLNGSQYDHALFHEELQKIAAFLTQQAQKKAA